MTTMVRLSLRLGRWGIIGFSAIAFINTLLQGVAFYRIAGTTPAERAKFGQSMSVLAQQFSVIIPPPIRLDTVGGYVQWRAFGFFAILFAIWALVSATGAARGDEERGIVEVVLATGLSRARMIGARLIAFALGSVVAALAASTGLLISVATGGESFSTLVAVEAAVPLAALAICCYGLASLISQFTSARSAIAVAGVVLLDLFLLNSLSRTFEGVARWNWLSPFHYYELSRPLPPGGEFDLGATIILLVVGVAAGALAALALTFRDLGSPLVRLPASSHPASYDVDTAPVLRIPIVRDLYIDRVSLVLWSVGMTVLGIVMVVLTKTIVEPLLAIPALKPYFDAFLHGAVYPSFLGFIWLSVAQLLMAGFAIAQVGRWAAEDTDGRLDLILSNPMSRARVILERAVVLTIEALIIAGISGVAVGLESHYQGIDLDRPHLIAATLLLVPFTLVFAAVGALLAARAPRATVGILGTFTFASYLLTQLGPIFKLPAWTLNASAFKLYGQPLAEGVDQTGFVIMIGIILAGFAASVIAAQRRDVRA